MHLATREVRREIPDKVQSAAPDSGFHGFLLNRPMLAEDLQAVRDNQWAREIRALVALYRGEGLPVMNGSFEYSNFMEGPARIFTCSPYRLWEYASLSAAWSGGGRQDVLDLGGATSPLPYLLAEKGHHVLTVDLQPLLVDVTNYVAAVRGIPLRATLADITQDLPCPAAKFDLATCISVLEHIDRKQRAAAFSCAYRTLKPGGLLYVTFDYGHYRAGTDYRRHEGVVGEVSESISDLDEFVDQATGAGLSIVGNDPRLLPSAVRLLTASPGWADAAARLSLNLGVVDADTP